MNNVLIDNQTFKIGDKVRVLRNDNPDKPQWKTMYYGVVLKVATKGWVYVWDPKIYDCNTGNPTESVEWIHSDCKMTRVIKD